MDQTTILIAFSVLMFAAIVGGTLVAWKAFASDAASTANVVTRVAVVFAIMIIVVFLAFAHELKEGVIALLSSVAGYALGGLGQWKRREHTPPREQSSQ